MIHISEAEIEAVRTLPCRCSVTYKGHVIHPMETCEHWIIERMIAELRMRDGKIELSIPLDPEKW